jgi:uncharacterized protein (DUF1330 family)
MKGTTCCPHHRASIDCPIKIDAFNLIGNTVPAYWISRCIINDPVVYKRYTDQVPDIIAKYGAKVLARGGHFQIMEGPEVFKRFVVIEFPTFASAVECFQSDAYKAAASHRRNGGGIVENVIVEGVEIPS